MEEMNEQDVKQFMEAASNMAAKAEQAINVFRDMCERLAEISNYLADIANVLSDKTYE